MKRFIAVLMVISVGIIFAGCSGGGSGKEAPGKTAKAGGEKKLVKEAVKSYLKTKKTVSLEKMTIEFVEISIEDDTAKAKVNFGLRNADEKDVSHSFQYDLEKIEGKWKVQKDEKKDEGMADHGMKGKGEMKNPHKGMIEEDTKKEKSGEESKERSGE